MLILNASQEAKAHDLLPMSEVLSNFIEAFSYMFIGVMAFYGAKYFLRWWRLRSHQPCLAKDSPEMRRRLALMRLLTDLKHEAIFRYKPNSIYPHATLDYSGVDTFTLVEMIKNVRSIVVNHFRGKPKRIVLGYLEQMEATF